jgi:hypothetical protein
LFVDISSLARAIVAVCVALCRCIASHPHFHGFSPIGSML